jgi:hypothetical protein
MEETINAYRILAGNYLEDEADDQIIQNCVYYAGSGSLPMTSLKISPEDAGDKFLRNVGKQVQETRRQTHIIIIHIFTTGRSSNLK